MSKFDSPEEVEAELTNLGHSIGVRYLDTLLLKDKSAKRPKDLKTLLQLIHGPLWKTLFGKSADALTKSTENENECLSQSFPYVLTHLFRADFLIDNNPMVTRTIPKHHSSHINAASFVGGIIRGLMDAANYVSQACHSS